MPEIVVCDDGDVGPMIGGQFMSLPNGRTVIKLPAWQTGPRGTLHPSLAHELAHAEAHQQGLSEPFGGHGTGFMTALLRAGWDLEAERVASMIAGADQALAAARQGLGGRRIAAEVPGESRPTRLMCENVARNYFVRMPDDTVSTRTICTVVCRQAPQ